MSDRSRYEPRSRTMREAALSIVTTLRAQGHEALFAGGCVRDMLMGREPSDYDVATSATPDEVISLFRKTQKVGAAFGVVLVRFGRFSIEVATFRRDAPYTDGRHPTKVEFTSAREDALRRDFTINGIFLDPVSEEVIDYVGGRPDIEARLIRAIGEPSHRFAEDHLRLLRAVRFAARFDFQIEPATWKALQENAQQIAMISAERIREELEGILADSSRARGFATLCAAGLIPHLWPESASVLEREAQITAELSHLPRAAAFEPAFAVILRRLGARSIPAVCDTLRCSNATKRRVEWLCTNQDSLREPARLTLADLKLLMQNESFDDLLLTSRARWIAESASLDLHDEVLARVRAIDPADISPPPLLTGHDLQEIGIERGPAYRKILDAVYYRQLNDLIRSHQEARDLAANLAKEIDRK